MASYVETLRGDIARWADQGLIDAPTQARLLADIASRPESGGIRFGTVLAMLAALLLGAALLLLVAANWEAFPRLMRVALVFAVILGGYVGGATLKLRGSDGFGEALWLVAAVAFGGGIALVAQMYHLSGDEASALLLWCGGAALAALLLRSGPLSAGAVLLAAIWFLNVLFDTRDEWTAIIWFPAILAGLWLVAMWTASVSARHAILLAISAYGLAIYVETGEIAASILLAAAFAGLFAAAVTAPDMARRLTGLGPGLLVQGLIGFIAGMSAVQFELDDSSAFLLVAILVFAGIVAALVLAGRESRLLRWLAYAAFVYEIAFIYVVLLGTQLGTAGFFLVAGLVLALLAFVIGRIEKRMNAPVTQGSAP